MIFMETDIIGIYKITVSKMFILKPIPDFLCFYHILDANYLQLLYRDVFIIDNLPNLVSLKSNSHAPNLLASKYSQGILFCACERKYSWNLIYSRVNLLLGLTRPKSILSIAHVSILKVLVMRTQTKFTHEYFFSRHR